MTWYSKKKKEEQAVATEEEPGPIIFMPPPSAAPEMRMTGVYGEISEEKCAELIYHMYSLKNSGAQEGEDGSLIYDPFAEALCGTKGKTLSDNFGKGCAYFEYESWEEFHKQ